MPRTRSSMPNARAASQMARFRTASCGSRPGRTQWQVARRYFSAESLAKLSTNEEVVPLPIAIA
jgi:hypothetical protein